MKKIIIATVFAFTGSWAYGQHLANYELADRLYPQYYSAVVWGANGYITVEEQDRLMDEAVAEHRREVEKENHALGLAAQVNRNESQPPAAASKAGRERIAWKGNRNHPLRIKNS